jgi:hypothetical protein
MLRACCVILVTVSACGPTPAPGADAGSQTDAAREADAGTGSALHGCSEASFVDRTAGADDDRMIMIPRGTMTLDLPCMTIRAGQSAMFMWDFAMFPLSAGVAPGHQSEGTGTAPSPIQTQSSGSVYSVAFPTQGTYPFYTTLPTPPSIYGVVRVVP